MTELRDARLRKAMDEAPDATLQPQQRTREAIRAAAHRALQPAWRRWWTRSGGGAMPWTAALATIALATLVTVMWGGRELPGARTEADVVATAPAPAAGPVPAPGPVPAAGPVPQELPAPAAASAPAPLPVPATRAERPESSQREQRARAVPAAPAPAAPAPVLPDAAGSSDVLARTAPAAEEARAAAAAPPPPPSVAAAAPTPPMAAPVPAPAAQRQAAPAAPTAALRASPASLPWTQVRIESGGRSVVIPRTQAGELPALVMSMLASPSEEPTTSASPTLRLELAQGDEAAGVLELVGDHWRWTRLRDARQTRVLRPEPGVAAALRTEAERLLRR
ncbi:hypothetical protein [Ramlibacter montanisoli]|uniref:Meckel syndrome type 1 protein n=1 Tax=Ramlibacter montanisoli TaxID=2732512 RepID=A0A849KKK7_9BURK|nr:hypothetical protein [Ramlibacter montanisoli]NNU44483.1 hypothetical protein [Ramlibacter montanisoli]